MKRNQSQREALRDDAVRLRDILREVRRANSDGRSFALFDARDALQALGIDADMIDGFDAGDDAALDHHIDHRRGCTQRRRDGPFQRPLNGAAIWPRLHRISRPNAKSIGETATMSRMSSIAGRYFMGGDPLISRQHHQPQPVVSISPSARSHLERMGSDSAQPVAAAPQRQPRSGK